MTSLVTSASPWISDDTNKKRIPTMKKPKINYGPELSDDPSRSGEVSSTQQGFQNLQPSNINDTNAEMEDRNAKVYSLLNKITTADTSTEANKMGDFKPMEPAAVQVKKDIGDDNQPKKYVAPTVSFAEATIERRTPSYGVNEPENAKYSNYMKSYEPPPPRLPYYAKMGLGQGTHDDKLMEKINYMIHLLEEQQNEKTSHITEEFLLYTFLGVFVIFVVDSFTKVGRYTR
jgi:hypothetical protein